MVSQVIWVVVSPRLGGGTVGSYYLPSGGTTLSSGGIARAQYLRLCQAVVLLSVRVSSGGTANTPEIRDKILFCFNFEVIGAYKYPTIFSA